MKRAWRYYVHEALVWFGTLVVLVLFVPALPLLLFVMVATKADEWLTQWECREQGGTMSRGR